MLGEGWKYTLPARLIARPYHYQTRRFGIEDKTQKIHQILHENALSPRQTLFVGDMEHDIEAGKAGGVHTCAVLTGYNHVEKLRAMSPDLICEHLGELQRALVERASVEGQDCDQGYGSGRTHRLRAGRQKRQKPSRQDGCPRGIVQEMRN